MKRYRLVPTGQGPIEFEGEELAHASSEGRRYHELTLFETLAGNRVLCVSYVSTWGHEAGATEVFVSGPDDDLEGLLGKIDPLAHLVGYPPDERYAQKQERLRAEIKRGWQGAVSLLLAQVPEAARRIQ